MTRTRPTPTTPSVTRCLSTKAWPFKYYVMQLSLLQPLLVSVALCTAMVYQQPVRAVPCANEMIAHATRTVRAAIDDIQIERKSTLMSHSGRRSLEDMPASMHNRLCHGCSQKAQMLCNMPICMPLWRQLTHNSGSRIHMNLWKIAGHAWCIN
jgi:hypothetical protein